MKIIIFIQLVLKTGFELAAISVQFADNQYYKLIKEEIQGIGDKKIKMMLNAKRKKLRN